MLNNVIEIHGKSNVCFSYSQFFVFDDHEKEPGSIWKDGHFAQGFVRRRYTVAFMTLIEFGTAEMRVFDGAPIVTVVYDRVICVPIEIPSGVVRIEGPEEYPVDRSINLTPGFYCIYAAQSSNDDLTQRIDLYFERTHSIKINSIIVKCDSALAPEKELIETGECA